MANNPYVNKVQLANGTTLIDITDTTAVASDVASGKYFYDATGVKVEGTASGGGAGAISIVDTADSAGGTVRTITAVDLSNDTVTASHLESGYTAHSADGTAITGTLEPGVDCPVFTITTSASTGYIDSITCNKTYAEADAYIEHYSSGHYTDAAVAVLVTDDPTITTEAKSPMFLVTSQNNYIKYYLYAGYGIIPSLEIDYASNGTITWQYDPIPYRDSTDLSASGATVTVPSGYYASQATKAVASGTAGTPTATKGTVSNHSISVTPSVTNTAGYISGGTINGTAVTVSASELVSGSETKTANGTYDVTNLAQLVVNVPSGGGGKNVQVAHGTKRVASQTYTDIGYEITVAKTGTYNVYWAGWRSSTSGTNGAQLYVNGTASGDAITTFDSTWTNVQNGSRTSVSLTANDKVTLRARSRGNSYYMYIFFLSIEEV